MKLQMVAHGNPKEGPGVLVILFFPCIHDEVASVRVGKLGPKYPAVL